VCKLFIDVVIDDERQAAVQHGVLSTLGEAITWRE
jgi:hypothetical protein